MQFIETARLDELLELEAEGAPGLVARLFAAFLTQAADDLAALRSALRTKDVSLASDASHRLRGAAGTLGAERLADICATMEAGAGSGDLSGYPALLERLQSELAGVGAAIDAWSER